MEMDRRGIYFLRICCKVIKIGLALYYRQTYFKDHYLSQNSFDHSMPLDEFCIFYIYFAKECIGNKNITRKLIA